MTIKRYFLLTCWVEFDVVHNYCVSENFKLEHLPRGAYVDEGLAILNFTTDCVKESTAIRQAIRKCESLGPWWEVDEEMYVGGDFIYIGEKIREMPQAKAVPA